MKARRSTSKEVRPPLGPYPPRGRWGTWFQFHALRFDKSGYDACIGDVAKCGLISSFRRIHRDRDGYLYGNRWDATRGKCIRVYLHRLLTNAPAGVLVDHRFGTKTDVRLSMLRYASHQENSWNRRKDRRRKCSSRYIGVTLKNGRWMAQSKMNGRNKYLGLHDTQEEAAMAYNRHAQAVRGRFARLNYGLKIRGAVRAKAQVRARSKSKARHTTSTDRESVRTAA